MKTNLISLGLISMIVGCSSPQQDDRAKEDTDEIGGIDSGSSVLSDPLEAIWGYEFNQHTEEFEVTQLRSVDSDTLTGETLEKIINNSWPKVQIRYIRTSKDTVYISIPDSKVLTQQMGSAGAESFMVSTTYSFTELNGVYHVSFDFEEGDHGVPGVYKRNSWDRNRNQ